MTQRSSPLRIAFRTDASIQIGTGHVMRCLTLAMELCGRGAECVFLCRPHEGHLIDLIAENGFTVLALDGPFDPELSGPNEAAPAHADWLGVSWQDDAADSRAALAGHFNSGTVDWIVVDHYSLDAHWERALRGSCSQLMVIDDLADRPHDCDLLLDQSLGRIATDYAGIIPEGATLLMGPSYALLRPEFARLRDHSLARRAEPRLERVLVTLGGVDKDNMTTKVLDILDASALPDSVRITVVMGPWAPFLDTVRTRAAQMRQPTEVLVGVSDMAHLMAESDLAIGAGGTTTWERCTLGLPTVTIVVAENQQEVAKRLNVSGASICISKCTVREELPNILASITPSELHRLSMRSREICDGTGTMLVGQKIQGRMPNEC